MASSGTELARTTLAYLRGKIASGEWPIDSRIPIEPELMAELGVGKTTVREAVRSLASLGMLETLPGRGTFVRSRTPITQVLTEYLADYTLGEIQSYRRALEIEAVQLAAQHRTEDHLARMRDTLAFDMDADGYVDEDYPTEYEGGNPTSHFHMLIIEASGSRLLPGLYAGAMNAIRAEVDRGQVGYGATPELRHDDHARILDAITRRDVPGAAHAMALHVDRDLVEGDAGIVTRRAEALLSRDDFSAGAAG